MKTLLRLLPLLLLVVAAACTPAAAPATDADGDADETPTPANGDSNGSGGDVDACINSVDEVNRVLGVQVEEAENIAAGVGASCTYYTDKDAFEVALAVTLQTSSVTVDMAADAFFNDPSFEDVSGIGDRAGWFGENDIFLIVKGDTLVSLTSGFLPEGTMAASREQLEELARLGADDF